jgi:molecular chaperone HtpG
MIVLGVSHIMGVVMKFLKKNQKDQKAIYYITAETYESAKGSPHLEIFNQKDIEVLLLSDRVDEWKVYSYA